MNIHFEIKDLKNHDINTHIIGKMKKLIKKNIY